MFRSSVQFMPYRNMSIDELARHIGMDARIVRKWAEKVQEYVFRSAPNLHNAFLPTGTEPLAAPAPHVPAPAPIRANNQPGQLSGVCAAPGLASGPLFYLTGVQLPPDPGNNIPEQQTLALNKALEQVRANV